MFDQHLNYVMIRLQQNPNQQVLKELKCSSNILLLKIDCMVEDKDNSSVIRLQQD